MFEVIVNLIDEKGLREKTIKTPKFGLWMNRYPAGHQLEGQVRDIRVLVEEDNEEVYYTTFKFTVKEVPE